MKNNSHKEKKNLAPIVIIRVNPEDLVHKSDEEIKSISDKLNKNLRIARGRRDDSSSKDIEKEICYLQREVRQREKRKNTHRFFNSKWCKSPEYVV